MKQQQSFKQHTRAFRVLAILLAAVLAVSLFGCKTQETPDTRPASEALESETDLPVTKEEGSSHGIPTEGEGLIPTESETEEPTESEIETLATEASEEESEEPTTVPPETLEYIPGYRVRITVPSARIRKAASLDSEVLGAAEHDDVFDVKGVEGAFYVIDVRGVTAYLHYTVVDYGIYELPTEPAPTPPPQTMSPTRAEYVPGNGLIVAIDAGHRPEGAISGVEPIGPGATETKRKLSTGTQGVDIAGNLWYERDINQLVAEKLKTVLESRGYTVFMVNRQQTNAERALEASASGASAYIRIHCNGSENRAVKGLMTYSPKAGNPFLGDSLIAESQRLSNCIAPAIVATTGVQFLGDLNANDMTGSNWSKIPVTIIEMGFMTNAEECTLLASPDYQEKMAVGIANGIDAYLGH